MWRTVSTSPQYWHASLPSFPILFVNTPNEPCPLRSVVVDLSVFALQPRFDVRDQRLFLLSLVCVWVPSFLPFSNAASPCFVLFCLCSSSLVNPSTFFRQDVDRYHCSDHFQSCAEYGLICGCQSQQVFSLCLSHSRCIFELAERRSMSAHRIGV